MPSVQLIVTGVTERQALPDALRAALPTTRAGELVVWRPPVQIDEPTMFRLSPLGRPAGLVMKLAQKLVVTLGGVSPGETPPDLVLAVGDLELNNLDQAPLYLAHLRAALAIELLKHPDAAAPLRSRCSVHLLSPMVEASFFGDSDTLGRAGVAPADRAPPLTSRDVEAFECFDPHPDWALRRASGQARNGAHWRHERHAADYLTHLTGRPNATRYGKTSTGVAALSALPWVDVIDTEPSPYLRALFDDLAAWFGTPSPLRPALTPAPLAPTHPDATAPAARLLRNL